ncbi:MAG: TolC family protein [Mastigocoleus sp. MO_167.B18]|uniref:TolC family protein n=1 Tax=Mastigocoleus sp. MO_188.B34 TaxID=3036635 RepID=UPI0026106BA9|nr:TolC family protein [Mastigocoleus sp. MO_188.B34]MDJ0772082.1 TolC family protein [Mastigocoleus sp. MO_167.B18]
MSAADANIYNKSENVLEDKSSDKSCMDMMCDLSKKSFLLADSYLPDMFNKYPAIFKRTLSDTAEFGSNKDNLDPQYNEVISNRDKLNNSDKNRNQSIIKSEEYKSKESNPKESNSEKFNPEQIPSPKPRKVTKLSLSDVVFLVIANNTDIKNAYLDRITQKQDLAIAKDKFSPDFTPTFSLSLDRIGNSDFNPTGTVDGKVQVKIPTGATLDFSWIGNAQTSNGNNGINDDIFRQSFQVDLQQPLLRGAGTRVNRASVKLARLQEKANIINLKSTLINTVTSSITAYRSLIQAQESVKISERALKNAQESLELTQALIDAGRKAPVEIVQNQTNIANLQFSLLSAKNALESSKIALLNILDIDQSTNIVADEIPSSIKAPVLNLDKLRQIALTNKPSYLISQINVSQNKLQLLEAKDRQRWDLNLTATLRNEIDRESDARAGLSLSRTIGDLNLKQALDRARISLIQSENSLQDQLATLELELQDRIRNVNLSFSQLELARDATRLSQKQLEIEQEKRKLGLGEGTIFELISFQDRLAQARTNELNAKIGYLNALTNLDQFLGTTLQTWKIEIGE